MARYFQHIDQNDALFQTVTELAMIDNTDPSFLMFYFTDGSKCSKEFIGAVGQEDAFGKKAFVELTSATNKWHFKEVKLEEQVHYKIGEDGQRYEIVDPYMLNKPDQAGKSRWNIFKSPNIIPHFITEADDKYFLIKDDTGAFNLEAGAENPADNSADDFDFNIDTSSNDFFSQDNKTINEDEKVHRNASKPSPKDEIEEANVVMDYSMPYEFDTDKVLKHEYVTFKIDGHEYTMKSKEFFNNAIYVPKDNIIEKEVEKIVEKVVEKEVVVYNDEHLQIDLEDNQKMLIDNMIDMSQKDKCDIDMSITLSLPPIAVYKLLKQTYSEEMAKAFVDIIADRMQILELKSAVAAGLMTYYDENPNISIEADK